MLTLNSSKKNQGIKLIYKRKIHVNSELLNKRPKYENDLNFSQIFKGQMEYVDTYYKS